MRKAGQEKKDKNAFTAKNGGVKSRRMEKKIQTSLDLENIRLFVSAWTVPDIQASDADYKYWWEKKNLLPEYSQCASYPFPGILTRDPKLELKTYKAIKKPPRELKRGYWETDRCAQTEDRLFHKTSAVLSTHT